MLRQVVYEGLREEAGGRRGSPADAALTTLTASLNDQIGPTIGGGCRGLVTIVKKRGRLTDIMPAPLLTK